jgi:MFS family permease
MTEARLVFRVLLPLAAGYYLTYLFRTINALIADDLTAELDVSAADLGFLTSIYFLVFASAQLPLGTLLDRYGPAIIPSALLLFASAGALVFATASSLFGLIAGRALLALGVAMALMAGFKAIVLWYPPERIALANGWLVMLGALGAVTATGPAEFIVRWMGWRGLFVLLAALSAIVALLIISSVPDPTGGRPAHSATKGASRRAVFRDRRFWRIAPLSATGISTSWSLQGLWAAAWLRDVDHLDRAGVVQHLTVMAVAVCFSAWLLGQAAGRLRRIGIKTEWMLASTLMISMAAQALLVFRFPVPPLLLWSVIAAAGAATVLSFAILADYFPKEMSGRANAALNLLHLGCAFVLQWATGLVIEQWPQSRGMHPPEAHQMAMAATLALQLVALGWFATSPLGLRLPWFRRPLRQYLWVARSPLAIPVMPYMGIRSSWNQHSHHLHRQAVAWRFAAGTSATLCFILTTALYIAISRPAVAVHIIEAGARAELASDARNAGIAKLIGDRFATHEALSVVGWPSRALVDALAGFPGLIPVLTTSPSLMARTKGVQR